MEVNAEYFLSTLALALVVLLGDRVGSMNVAVLSQLCLSNESENNYNKKSKYDVTLKL